jgi:hypothetical protein
MPTRIPIIRAQSNPQRKEGKPITMKYLAIIALAAMALSLGACASKPAPTTTTTSTSHGYSK